VRVESFAAVGYALISVDIGVVEPPPPTDGPPKAVISGPTEAQVGQPVVFSARNSSVAPGSHLTTFEWTFGDGTIAKGVDVTHIYTNPGDYQVTLTVTDDKARSDTATQGIKINPAPVAPTATPTVVPEGPDAVINAPGQAVVGQPVTFDGSQSSGPNPIVSYRWAFGDGSTADAVTVQKTYNAVGVFNVNLTVTDDKGLEDTETKQITIVEQPPPDATDTPVPPATDTPVPEATDTPVPGETDTPVPEETDTPVPEATDTPVPEVTDTPVPEVTDTPVPEETPTPEEEQPPTANIQGPTEATVGVAVNFDGSGSQAGSSQITSYEWAFGDGGTESGPSVSYTYSGAGDFTVTLTVTDENGLTDDASQGISVTEQ
jgi:PKD repeat protein